jgi:hypothetical protein
MKGKSPSRIPSVWSRPPSPPPTPTREGAPTFPRLEKEGEEGEPFEKIKKQTPKASSAMVDRKRIAIGLDQLETGVNNRPIKRKRRITGSQGTSHLI